VRRPAIEKPWTLRRAVAGYQSVLRDLRLQALAESPQACGSSFERELARTTENWRRWLSPEVTFVLEGSRAAHGIIAAVLDSRDPGIVRLLAMWVQPEIRGTEAADELMTAVLEWARSEGAKTVRLAVVKENNRARRFYVRNGFRITGEESAHEPTGLVEVHMARRVDGTAALIA
jgi:GNAT superfamily N-acetyltransferase